MRCDHFVQRFGSLNLNVHFHLACLMACSRATHRRYGVSPADAAAAADLDSIARRVRDRSVAWLRRHGISGRPSFR